MMADFRLLNFSIEGKGKSCGLIEWDRCPIRRKADEEIF